MADSATVLSEDACLGIAVRRLATRLEISRTRALRHNSARGWAAQDQLCQLAS